MTVRTMTDYGKCITHHQCNCLTEKMAALEARCHMLAAALEELLEVADLRGDNRLPHPADDPKLWSARMQTAWDEAAAALTADDRKTGERLRLLEEEHRAAMACLKAPLDNRLSLPYGSGQSTHNYGRDWRVAVRAVEEQA